MKNLIITLTVITLLSSCGNPPAAKENWISLFNGQNLEGWIIKIAGSPLGENYKNTFMVEDGVIKVSYSEYEQFNNEFGHIYYQTPYSSYRLRVEYRFTGEQCPDGPSWAYRNSGIMFHSQSPESVLEDQSFPVSIEAQFLGGTDGDVRHTMNVCTPGTHIVIDTTLITDHCIPSSSATFTGDVWVTAELIVYGDSLIHHLVNGDTVMTYSKPQIGGDKPEGFPLPDGTPLEGGYISLQAESHPVEFRKVELLVLER
ncbi:MAG: DUF1080 domain-containing protein [Bacteroidales bacterium]|jgi:hypothetical protein|nr:DUF1080 domain-containing protein [Bacteroidales bacterium]